MYGTAYMVKARVNGETAENIVFLTDEFVANTSESQFRDAMRSSVAGLIEERFGVGVDFELTWERGEPASLALS